MKTLITFILIFIGIGALTYWGYKLGRVEFYHAAPPISKPSYQPQSVNEQIVTAGKSKFSSASLQNYYNLHYRLLEWEGPVNERFFALNRKANAARHSLYGIYSKAEVSHVFAHAMADHLGKPLSCKH